MAKKRISFRIGEKRFEFDTDNDPLSKWLEQQDNMSKAITEILFQYITGQLLPKAKAEKSEMYLDAKIRATKARAIRAEVLAKVDMITKLKISPDMVIKIMEGHQNVLDVNVPTDEILQPDGRLRCRTCGTLFERTDPTFAMCETFRRHLERDHQRELKQDERSILMKLLGDSK